VWFGNCSNFEQLIHKNHKAQRIKSEERRKTKRKGKKMANSDLETSDGALETAGAVGVVDTGDVETRAKRMGWVPLDDFRGDPDRHLSPEEYIRRAEEQLPIAKGTLRQMEKKMAAQEALLREQSERMKHMQSSFEKFVTFSKASEERAYNKALEELKTKQLEAVESGDVDAFKEVSKELDEHIKTRGEAVGEAVGKERGDQAGGYKPPEWAEPGSFEAWLSENSWFNENPRMANFAHSMDALLHRTKPKLRQSERLAEITKLVREEFPGYFGSGSEAGDGGVEREKRRGSPVEGSGTGGYSSGAARSGSQKGRSYYDLPPEARRMCDEWTGNDGKGKTGTLPGFTREDYLKNYKWD
jgi:hypothetical protein